MSKFNNLFLKVNQNFFRKSSNKKYHLICGGSIINKWQFLTAAHCVYGYNIKGWRISAGSRYLPNPSHDKWYQRVFRVKIHRKYKEEEFHDDIAIVTVKPAFDFRSRNVKPIRLETSFQIPRKGEFCSIAGWGAIGLVSHQLYKFTK